MSVPRPETMVSTTSRLANSVRMKGICSGSRGRCNTALLD